MGAKYRVAGALGEKRSKAEENRELCIGILLQATVAKEDGAVALACGLEVD